MLEIPGGVISHQWDCRCYGDPELFGSVFNACLILDCDIYQSMDFWKILAYYIVQFLKMFNGLLTVVDDTTKKFNCLRLDAKPSSLAMISPSFWFYLFWREWREQFNPWPEGKISFCWCLVQQAPATTAVLTGVIVVKVSSFRYCWHVKLATSNLGKTFFEPCSDNFYQ